MVLSGLTLRKSITYVQIEVQYATYKQFTSKITGVKVTTRQIWTRTLDSVPPHTTQNVNRKTSISLSLSRLLVRFEFLYLSQFYFPAFSRELLFLVCISLFSLFWAEKQSFGVIIFLRQYFAVSSSVN